MHFFVFSSNTLNTFFFFLILGDEFNFHHYYSHHHHPIVDEEKKTRSLISHGTTIFTRHKDASKNRGLREKMEEENHKNMIYSPFSHHLLFMINNLHSLNKKF